MLAAIYVVGAYVVILFVLSAFVIEKALHSYEEYSYCGRSLSIVFILMTYFSTWIGGGTIVGLVERSYEFGASQYWIIGMSCVVEIFFAIFFIKRIRESEIKTIGQFFERQYPKYGGVVRIPVTMGLLIRNVSMIAMQFGSLSYLITMVFGINRNLSLLLIFIIITSYTVLSGLWGVVATDVFQGVLQTAGLIILILVSLKVAGGLDNVAEYYRDNSSVENLNLFATKMNWWEMLLYVIGFGSFFLMNDQTSWERIYASKSGKVAKWGFIIPLIITMMMLVLVVYLGVFERVIMPDVADTGSVIYDFIFKVLDSKLGVLVIVALIAAIMSSADSFLLASGTMIAQDIIKKFVFKKASDREMIFWTRIFVLFAGATGFAFALNTEDILELWLAGIGMTTVILIPGYFLGWFHVRIRTKGALLGMAIGITAVVLMALKIIAVGPVEVCCAMLLNLLACVIYRGKEDVITVS